MTEILWIGRGGQGAFTAAKLLGAAFAGRDDRCHALAFPSFGPERRGAPVRAFTKLDSSPILDRSQTSHADYIVVLDDTLYSDALTGLLKAGGKIILNTKTRTGDSLLPFDASALAASQRLPVVNTIMLGALAEVSGAVTLEEVQAAIDGYMPAPLREKNKAAVLAAAEEVRK